jgi:hypothetical protein
LGHGHANQPHHRAALAIVGLPCAESGASMAACPIPKLILALPQRFENGRHSTLEIQSRSDIDGHDVPETLRDFVDSHAGPDRQLTLRLA